MKRRNVAVVAVLVVLLAVSLIIAAGSFFLSAPQTAKPEFYVGVQCGYSNVTLCKALIDKTKNYTNLFVIGATDIVTNATALNEVCDYAYAAGLHFLVYFSISQSYPELGEIMSYTYPNGTVLPTPRRSNLPIAWIDSSVAKYGDHFLGAYVFDEPGGNQLDGGTQRKVHDALDYVSAAGTYVSRVNTDVQPYLSASAKIFTADYGLYWFDYKAGFDVVLADFGFGNIRQLQVSLCRGAAKVQGRDWGIMITHEFSGQFELESGTELYEDLVLGFDSGAKYAVVFDYAETEGYPKEDYQPYEYGILQEEHFEALRDFWTYVESYLEKHGSLKADVALVLPEAYGFGFRNDEDTIWGIFSGDAHSQALWSDANSYLGEYGSRLDIVYRDAASSEAVKNGYSQVFYWSSGNASDSFPVRNINSTFSYSNIQAAINAGATANGHTLMVKAGTYRENLVINKTLTIVGEDAATTIVDSGDQGTVVDVTSSNATFKNFTVKNSGASQSGIRLQNVANCSIAENRVEACGYGIYLSSSTGNTLRNNVVGSSVYGLGVDGNESLSFFNDIDDSNTVNGKKVHYLTNRGNLVLDQTTVPNAGYVALINCSGVTVQGLSLSGNNNGLLLVDTQNSTLRGNAVEGCGEGVRLLNSQNNVLKGNRLSGNTFNFMIQNSSLNDVDTSNTVNGKPIYYWISQHDKAVPSDAGYVALVNCSGITVQGLSLSENWQGILLSSTTDSIIEKNQVSDCYYGIMLENESNHNTISANNATDNAQGLTLSGCRDNSVKENAFAGNQLGVYAIFSSSNTFSENTISGNADHGVLFFQNCNGVTLTGNQIENNNVGVEFKDSSSCSVVSNDFSGNTYSIQVHGSSSNTHIAENAIGNSTCGVEITLSSAFATYNDVQSGTSIIVYNAYDSPAVSRSHSVVRNTLTNNQVGIVVTSVNDTVVADNAISEGDYGVALGAAFGSFLFGIGETHRCQVQGNTITDCLLAISMFSTRNCTIAENSIIKAADGIQLSHMSLHNRLLDNSVSISGSDWEKSGIQIDSNSYGNTLRRNSIVAKVNGFGDDSIDLGHPLGSSYNPFTGETTSEPEYLVNDVDSSNTVNGKPIYYWVSKSDKTVPNDASCVILVNCKNITVQNLNLTGNQDGVQLAYTHNSTIEGNIIRGNSQGIRVICSSYNRIEGNNITNNWNGITLDQKSVTTSTTPNGEGSTTVYPSTGNTIAGNNITSNKFGISIYIGSSGPDPDRPLGVSGNTLYHNNFLNNTNQPSLPEPFRDQTLGMNDWDNGAEGNFWGDYDGTDADGDGIGDTPYTLTTRRHMVGGESETIVAGEDRFPLMHPFTR